MYAPICIKSTTCPPSTLARDMVLDSLRASSPPLPSHAYPGYADLEKYSDQAWIMRYRKERDAALKAHRRQYRRRQILSKLGLARAPVSDEYERFIDVDRVRRRPGAGIRD